jgi:predicted DNA-binding protein
MSAMRLRLTEFTGDRLTVRLDHRDREALRALARQLGISESHIVREAISARLART